MRRTSSGRSIRLYPGHNGRCSKTIEVQNRTVQTFGFVYHDTNGPNHGPAWKTSRSSWKESVRSSLGWTIMGTAIWENPIAARLGEGFQLGMLIRTPWKRVVLICVCGRHQNWLERNKTLIRCGKYSIKKLIWENQHLSLIMFSWLRSKCLSDSHCCRMAWCHTRELVWNWLDTQWLQSWEKPIEKRLGESFQLGMFFVSREKGLYVDDIKLAWKKQNISPTWKILMKDVDLGEPTSFLDHVYLGCTQRECQKSKDVVDNYRSMFESRISAVATDKLSETKAARKPDAKTISSWSRDMEGNAKKCVERYCNFANKQQSNYTKSQRHAWMIIKFKKKKKKWIIWRLVHSLLTHSSEMSKFGLYW